MEWVSLLFFFLVEFSKRYGVYVVPNENYALAHLLIFIPRFALFPDSNFSRFARAITTTTTVTKKIENIGTDTK